MKYFLHDTSAFQDEKISQLFIKFGYEGIGLFFTLLEKIALQEKPVNSLVLKKQLFIGKKLEKCWNFMEEIDLISTKNGETFNENLLKFSEKYRIKKEKTREKVSQWREKQKDIKNVTGYVPDCNHPKVKKSKVKENNNNSVFDFKNEFKKLGVEENIINDWLKVRKAKKGVNTQTAFNAIKKEIELSGLTANTCIKVAVERNWVGFKYEWLKPQFTQKKIDYSPGNPDDFKNPEKLKFR